MRIGDGRLNKVTPTVIAGWAFLDGQSDPAELAILVNGVERWRIFARLPRPQTKTQFGHPTGNCGFHLKIPDDAALKASDLIDVTFAVNGQSITGSPMFCKVPPEYFDQNLLTAEELDLPEPPKVSDALKRNRIQVFINTILVLMLRDTRSRYANNRLGFFWALVQPVLMVVVFRQARHMLKSGGSDEMLGVSATFYFATGILPFFVYSHSMSRGMGAMASGRQLYGYRQVQPLDVLLARVLMEFVTFIVSFTLLIAVLEYTGQDMSFADPLGFIVSVSWLFILGLGTGLTADVLVTINPDSRMFINLVERPLFFISGIFFVATDLSPGMWSVLQWNPLLHAIDLGRGALFVQYESPCSYWYLGICSTLMLTLGLMLYRRYLHEIL